MSWRNKFGIYQHRNGIKTTRMGRIIKEKVQMKKNTNERALKNFNSGGLGKREETTKKKTWKDKRKTKRVWCSGNKMKKVHKGRSDQFCQ